MTAITRPGLPPRVTIREVGPRDGLQSERPLPVEDRARLITALSLTGVAKIEAVSFVSPSAVPAMAGAADAWALVDRVPSVSYSALVPNRRGAEAALEAGGFASLQAFIAASDGYSRKNVGKTVAESTGDVAEVLSAGRDGGVPVEVTVSVAFGDPFDGDVPPHRVVEIAEALASLGAAAVSLGDTTGMATPARVWDLLEVFAERLPTLPLNMHFHDTRGTAMANVLAAMEGGVEEFDASVAGLGGSPFAPGAGGNVATEDLVHMLDDMGIETGVDLDRVLDAAGLVESLLDRTPGSHVFRAGPRWRAGPRRAGADSTGRGRC